MLRRFTAFVALALCSLAGFMPGTVGTSHAQNRHIMLEEFTGSWCGWCPRGAYAMEQIDKKYPGQVFAVAIHNQDPMVTGPGDTLQAGISGISAASKITGFPSSWVARTAFSGSWIQDPQNWTQHLPGVNDLTGPGLVDQMVDKPADVVVTTDNVTYDLATGMVSCRVSAKFVKAMTGEFHISLFVTEDSVSGPAGSQYDQHCYYATNSSLPNNPWYGGPAVIAGWQHMHVLRMAPAGAWGVAGVIPSSAAAGATYSQNFTFKLPASIANPNKAHLLGFVNQFSTTDASMNSILDASQATLPTVPISGAFKMTPKGGSKYIMAKAGGMTTQTITITNKSSNAITVNLFKDDTTWKLGTGWAISASATSVDLPANGSKDVDLTITAPTNSAYIQTSLLGTSVETGKYSLPATGITIGALSDNTKYGMVYTNPEYATIYGMPATLRTNMSFMPLTPEIMAAYDPVKLYDVLIISDPYVLDGASGPSVTGAINGMLAAGKKVFISSNEALCQAFASNNAADQSVDAQSFYQDTLGMIFGNVVVHLNAARTAYASFTLTGLADPITTKLTPLTCNSTGLVAYALEGGSYTIADGFTKSTPLYTFGTDATQGAGLRYENEAGGRVVYYCFSLNSMASQAKADTLFARSIKWLLSAPTAATVAVAGGAAEVKFGAAAPITWNVKGTVGPTVDIDLSMDGKKTWSSITKGVATSAGSYAWTVPSFASANACIRLTFSDNTQAWSSFFTISAAGGVGFIPSNGTDLTASPNPFHGTTQVRYTAANLAGNVTFTAVDLLGREVATIPSSKDGDAFVANFDATKLAAGTYVIMAHAADGVHQLRVVNTK